ncbi:hypothetical protein HPB51_002817 [Rhipicephalus microplus]|uniref:Tudor domain-containing protein n=1 Tax=Rhipicephalus microplus TaxID=6941 RepID=A0A9J6EWM8_RHIMP|nr:hypothetical protein HPB51_002817 [Rhipicephalus microplus]
MCGKAIAGAQLVAPLDHILVHNSDIVAEVLDGEGASADEDQSDADKCLRHTVAKAAHLLPVLKDMCMVSSESVRGLSHLQKLRKIVTSLHVAFVAFCYGSSLSEFYVQDISQMPELALLQANLHTLCAISGGHKPTQGETCAALFADDGQWYRARVTSLGSTCTVYFIDYGNVAEVPCESICRLPDQCKELPPQAVRCRLHAVRPASGSADWTEEAFSLLVSMIKEGTMFANVQNVAESFVHEVELKPKTGGPSLNEQLVAKGLAERVVTADPAAVPTPEAVITPAVAADTCGLVLAASRVLEVDAKRRQGWGHPTHAGDRICRKCGMVPRHDPRGGQSLDRTGGFSAKGRK